MVGEDARSGSPCRNRCRGGDAHAGGGGDGGGVNAVTIVGGNRAA